MNIEREWLPYPGWNGAPLPPACPHCGEVQGYAPVRVAHVQHCREGVPGGGNVGAMKRLPFLTHRLQTPVTQKQAAKIAAAPETV